MIALSTHLLYTACAQYNIKLFEHIAVVNLLIIINKLQSYLSVSIIFSYFIALCSGAMAKAVALRQQICHTTAVTPTGASCMVPDVHGDRLSLFVLVRMMYFLIII